MSRAVVTPELAETLRNLRLENRIQAKDLADHIGKSRAFISRLENGTIKSIDSKDLLTILNYILDTGGNLDDSLEKIYSLLEFKYTQQEIREQLWFTNYDTVERYIPIPEDLVSYMNQLIDELGITQEYLLSRINANESLTQSEIDDPSIPYNQWYRRTESSNTLDSSIKLQISKDTLHGILSGELDTTPYIFILGILFYLLKIKRYPDRIEISHEEYEELFKDTIDCLNRYKFYSISERNRLMSSQNSSADNDELLSVHDIENRDALSRINSYFKMISDLNIKYANKSLTAFGDNLASDIGFMMRIIGIDYTALDHVSVSNKKELLEEIQKLVSKYSALPEEANIIETY